MWSLRMWNGRAALLACAVCTGGTVVTACAPTPRTIENYAYTLPFKARDTISREMRLAMAKAEERRIVDSVLAAVRALPPRPVGEALLAVDDSVDVAQDAGAVPMARYTDPGYRGFYGRSFEDLVVALAGRRPSSTPAWFLCARVDTIDLARARIVRRVAARDSSGEKTIIRRDYIRRGGRWYIVASAFEYEGVRKPCAAPVPRATLPF